MACWMCSEIAPAELYAREPNLAPGALGAAIVPGEHVIDPWSAPLAYALQAIAHGSAGPARMRGDGRTAGRCGLGARHRDGSHPGAGRDQCGRPATATSSRISPAHHRSPSVRARASSWCSTSRPTAWCGRSSCRSPRRAPRASCLARTAFGNVLVGPTAEEVEERATPRWTRPRCRALIDKAVALIPRWPATRSTRSTLACGRLRSSRTTRSPHCPSAAGSPSEASAPPGSPARSASPSTSPRLYAAHFGALEETTEPHLDAGAQPVPRSAARGWQQSDCRRDRVPLRAGDARRDRGRVVRPPAGRRSRRTQTPHPLPDGSLPGLLLHLAGRAARGRAARGCARAGEAARVTEHGSSSSVPDPPACRPLRSLRACGIDDVVVLEREQHAGGVPRHCGHRGFGWHEFSRLLTGPAYAKRLLESAHSVRCARASPFCVSNPAGCCPAGNAEADRQRSRGSAYCSRWEHENRLAPPDSSRATGPGVWSPPAPCSSWSTSRTCVRSSERSSSAPSSSPSRTC